MAITKIYAITKNLWYSVAYASNEKKTGLDGVIDYAVNPDKTEQRLFKACINCKSTDTAYAEMQNVKKRWKKENGVLGYHFIQSFKPGETTPEQAHQIGIEFAKQCFGDRFQVVIGTHLDKKHLHNHIVVNSVSFFDGKKYHSSPASYYNKIRFNSDKLCEENNLSIITPKGRGLHYAEWKAIKEGRPTIRGQIRSEIDEIIKCSYTMEQFWQNLKKRGFVIHRKGPNIKHTSIIAPNAKRPMRLDNLGKGYSEAEILERIIATRNGIITAAPSEMQKRQYKFRGNIKNVKGKKLKGFVALYFHYLYLFKKIQRKQTPQRVSFFMRDEMIKFDRYQKQFKFLFTHNIETGEDLQKYQKDKEAEVEILITRRKKLYEERTDENCDEVKDQAKEINAELNELRKEIRLCKAIFKDSYKIAEKKRQALALQKQADKEMRENEHKRRSR